VPARSAPVRSALLTWTVIALLFGGTLLLFSPAIGHGFINYDDPRYITHNAPIQAPFSRASVVWAFTGRAELWQPLVWFSHMADWQLYGENPAGHHFTSILWHALNAALVFVVFRRITGAFWTSALAAALFAWHPLRVESVAWVSERKDVMSGCFFLFTLVAYLGSADASKPTGAGTRRYGMALLCFALGLMCKPTLVTLPLLLLALDFWPLRRFSDRASVRAALLEKIPFFALSAVVSLVTIQLQRGLGFFTLDLPLAARLANAPVAMLRYLGKFVWPDHLSVCYPHPGWWPASTVVVALLIVATISVLAWHRRHTQPWLLTGWVWFVALLLPTIGLIQVGFQSMADRYTYLPMLGWELVLLGGLSFGPLARAGRLVAIAAAACLLGALATRTRQQETVWRDSLGLFEHAIAASGSSTVTEGFLGYTLASLGRLDEAVTHCERALQLDARNEMAVYTLARVRSAQGRPQDAIAGYTRALELKPNDPTTEYELALQLLSLGREVEAAQHLKNAARQETSLASRLRRIADDHARAGRMPAATLHLLAACLLEPNDADLQLITARALVGVNQDAAAAPHLRRALALAPQLPDAHLESGHLLVRQHAMREAALEYRAVLAREPNQAEANAGLGRALEALGETTEADAAFARALQATPETAEVVRAWADVLARRGRFSDAVVFYRKAVQLQPQDATNHAGLGYALLLSGRRSEAAAAWEEALRLDPHFPGLRERLARLGVSGH
jgi:tetratricopeptide (TPR) repeat protein